MTPSPLTTSLWIRLPCQSNCAMCHSLERSFAPSGLEPASDILIWQLNTLSVKLDRSSSQIARAAARTRIPRVVQSLSRVSESVPQKSQQEKSKAGPLRNPPGLVTNCSRRLISFRTFSSTSETMQRYLGPSPKWFLRSAKTIVVPMVTSGQSSTPWTGITCGRSFRMVYMDIVWQKNAPPSGSFCWSTGSMALTVRNSTSCSSPSTAYNPRVFLQFVYKFLQILSLNFSVGLMQRWLLLLMALATLRTCLQYSSQWAGHLCASTPKCAWRRTMDSSGWPTYCRYNLEVLSILRMSGQLRQRRMWKRSPSLSLSKGELSIRQYNLSQMRSVCAGLGAQVWYLQRLDEFCERYGIKWKPRRSRGGTHLYQNMYCGSFEGDVVLD